MPYGSINELPSSIKDTLPTHAQQIYVAAFNASIKEGKSETVAFKIAWSAVKNKYRKVGDKWVKKEFKSLSTPAYVQGPALVSENLNGGKTKKKKHTSTCKHYVE